MGTIAGAHGPPIALIYQRETPSRIRAALLPFFALANPISLVGLAAVGMFGWREIYASALLLPGLVGLPGSSASDAHTEPRRRAGGDPIDLCRKRSCAHGQRLIVQSDQRSSAAFRARGYPGERKPSFYGRGWTQAHLATSAEYSSKR